MTRRSAPHHSRDPLPKSSDWQVKRDGARRASAIEPTQTRADDRAREIARNSGGGRIRSEDSVGGAPGRNCKGTAVPESAFLAEVGTHRPAGTPKAVRHFRDQRA
jgi:hypothetical protein